MQSEYFHWVSPRSHVPFSLTFGSHVAKRRDTSRQEMIQSLGWVQPKRGVIEDWKIFMESSMEVASLEKMLISQGGEQARDAVVNPRLSQWVSCELWRSAEGLFVHSSCQDLPPFKVALWFFNQQWHFSIFKVVRIGIHSSKSSRFCQIAILHHPWPSMVIHGQAQNLWELHEAGSSMDFFKRTVAALAKGKPEDAISSGSCGSGMWESLGNTMFYSKSRTTHAILILDLSFPLFPPNKHDITWHNMSHFMPFLCDHRDLALLRHSQDRICNVCMEEDLPLARLAITPCAHAFCSCLRCGSDGMISSPDLYPNLINMTPKKTFKKILNQILYNHISSISSISSWTSIQHIFNMNIINSWGILRYSRSCFSRWGIGCLRESVAKFSKCSLCPPPGDQWNDIPNLVMTNSSPWKMNGP